MNKGVIYFTEIKEDYKEEHLEHMIGEKLLETGLRKEYGYELEFEPRAEGEHGKPFLSMRPEVHYNISHSGKYVLCILADQEVGIDVQVHRKANYKGMLRRIVPEEMIEQIMGSSDPVKNFFTQWVLREAYIKWTGEGLSRDMRTIPMEEGASRILEMEQGYSGAVWSMDPMELRWEHIETDIE